MSLWAELRRRNVIRMAGLYLVVAWLVVQVVDTLLPIFDAPGWVSKVLVALLAIGFVPALVFAWVFELTPEGVKRDAEVSRAQSLVARTGQRMDRLIVAGLLAVAAVIAAGHYWPGAEQAAQTLPATGSGPGASVVAAMQVKEGRPDAVSAGPGIAVLPFDNLSPDPDNAYFAGGIHEEVLTKLSKLAELRVISRTSMERIAEEKLDVAAIGQRLGVSHVLEGSVRRAGEQVRVTVQLIEAATDRHVWAENYDRKLDDVFAIQSEIALAIADQLKISLAPQIEANLSERPTSSNAAYELYLRALAIGRSWGGPPGFRSTIELLEPAIQLDPQFLVAHVLLSEAHGRMHWLRADPDGYHLTRARQLVADIAARWPGRLEAELAQAQLTYNVDQDYARALQAFEALRARAPNHPVILSFISACLKREGHYEAFLRASRAALAVDPESPGRLGDTANALLANLRYDEALALARQARVRFPEDRPLEFQLALTTLLHRGDLDPMLDYGLRMVGTSDVLTNDDEPVMIARFIRGDVDGALAVLEQQPWPTPRAEAWGAAQRAELLRLAGRNAEADALAREAYEIALQTTDRQPPRADLGAGFWYATAAQIAAQAGEREAALAWQQKAMASPAPSKDAAEDVARALSATQRGLGDAEAAWNFVATYAGDVLRLSDDELRAFKPWYDRLYGESPSYRAYMAELAPQP